MKDFILPTNIVCGYFDSRLAFGTATNTPPRTTDNFEIEFYLADCGVKFINGVKTPLKKGYVSIVKPGFNLHSTLPFKTVYIKFNATGYISDILSSVPDFFYCTESRRIKTVLHNIISEYESELRNEFFLQSKILELVGIIKNEARVPSLDIDIGSDKIYAAKKYAEEHFRENLTGEQIAKSVYMSESRLRFLFKKVYGYTLHQYITNLRINAVKEALWNTDISLSQIALDSGFGCQQYMNDVFKKVVGTSPGKYRNDFKKRYTL